MAKKNSRYALMERRMKVALIVALSFFILFLIASGAGTIWLKVLCGIVSTLICVLCFLVLLLTKEWLSPRSLWMSVASIALVVCILFSIILNYPSPSPI